MAVLRWHLSNQPGTEHHAADPKVHERDAHTLGLGLEAREDTKVYGEDAEANEHHDQYAKGVNKEQLAILG